MNRFLNIVFLGILISATPHAFAQSHKSVEEHRERLPNVAVNFVQIFSDRFPNAFRHIHVLHEYMGELHDIVKVMSVDELRDYQYQHDQDVLTRLAFYSGVPLAKMPEAMRAEFEAFKAEFNAIEEGKKSEFFMFRGFAMDDPLIQEIKMVEVIVDLTDTGIFRRKEMGIKSDMPYNGADFLLKQGYPAQWAAYSRMLEDSYDEFMGATFIPVPRMTRSCARAYQIGGMN